MVDVCEVPVISAVCSTAGEAAGVLVAAPFEWLAQAMAHTAAFMVEALWSVFDSTTMVDVTSEQYTGVYNILFGVAVFVMLGFFLLQVIGAMIRREPAALSRAVFGLAKSILGSFVALTLIGTALEVTDQLCIGIVAAAGTSMEEMGAQMALLVGGLTGLHLAAPGAGAILTLFIAGLAVGAAAIVWISLLVRKALLLVAIVFAPIALAGASWDHTRGWVSKWASFVIALIVSKVVLVVIFLLATAQVSTPIDADLQSVSDPIAGVVLMLMAGFAPYMTYKAISFMGFDMYHAMSAEQEAKSALNRPIPIPVNRAPGTQPSKVLTGPTGNPSAGPPTPSASSAAKGSGPASGTTAAGAPTSGAAGGAAAAGGVAAGAVAVKEVATAGVRTGASVGGFVSRQADAADQSAVPGGAPMPPHVADSTPAASSGKKG